jgi:hypothetical protein
MLMGSDGYNKRLRDATEGHTVGLAKHTTILVRCGMAIVVILLTLCGSTPAQTPTHRPTPSATPPRVERLKAAVQSEHEQNDPILMTVIYAAQYVPVYEALVEEDP